MRLIFSHNKISTLAIFKVFNILIKLSLLKNEFKDSQESLRIQNFIFIPDKILKVTLVK